MDFGFYDIILLVLFIIIVSLFLYIKRDNLKREKLFFLYRTKWGIKLINSLGKKYQKTLKVLSYFSIILGYILMIGMAYLFGKMVWIYAFNADLVRAIKVPPVIPLIPYLPKIFNLDFLQPFYFTYWIIILAIIAITHEFFHGIFAVYNHIKIKTTGFGFFPFFLPVLLAAFVELDEKKMNKKSKFSQMAVLSAGTFANILTAIFFLFVLWIFFFLTFAPSGIIFNDYSYSVVPVASITMINNISVSNHSADEITSLMKNDSFNYIEAGGIRYSGIKAFSNENRQVALYDDAPAINYNLSAIILEVNGKKVTSTETFKNELAKYSPGEKILLKTKGNGIKETEVILGKNPENKNIPFLGIAFVNTASDSFTKKILSIFLSFRNPNIYYESKFGEIGLFVYNLLWWLILISFSVALVNMLPIGIFDGGKFFYLTMLGITKNAKSAKRIFSFISFFLFLLIILVMFFWILAFTK